MCIMNYTEILHNVHTFGVSSLGSNLYTVAFRIASVQFFYFSKTIEALKNEKPLVNF